jgi:hypothetical protein
MRNITLFLTILLVLLSSHLIGQAESAAYITLLIDRPGIGPNYTYPAEPAAFGESIPGSGVSGEESDEEEIRVKEKKKKGKRKEKKKKNKEKEKKR